ncbi:hypothetical protein QU38_02580, partial [Staphylococcus aureus]
GIGIDQPAQGIGMRFRIGEAALDHGVQRRRFGNRDMARPRTEHLGDQRRAAARHMEDEARRRAWIRSAKEAGERRGDAEQPVERPVRRLAHRILEKGAAGRDAREVEPLDRGFGEGSEACREPALGRPVRLDERRLEEALQPEGIGAAALDQICRGQRHAARPGPGERARLEHRRVAGFGKMRLGQRIGHHGRAELIE